jgi:group II intron reverse transcriptase/maturase
MSTERARIREKAKSDRKAVFTSLYHHITDEDNLRACYHELNGRKALGVDKVSKEEYGRELESNLSELSERLKRGGYRPLPARRVYIPKEGSEKGRPLGISSFECKIVELSIKRTLEGIYEESFEESSYGFRENRNQHQCLDKLGRTIQQKRVSYVVEADIRSFFDRVNHDWLMKFLEHRIGDRRVLKLVKRMLNAGIMEDGLVKVSDEGTPQGSILSPLLSNIYLHYVLDLWFRLRIERDCSGEAYYFRYADDFVACFQYREDAEKFMHRLEVRLKEFGLELAKEKTRTLPFGRYAKTQALKKGTKPQTFTFLGFQHYCGTTRRGCFKVKRQTCGKRMRRKLREFSEWARKARCVMRKGDMIRAAIRKLKGHVNYYGVTDNGKRVSAFLYRAGIMLFKWLNRKSQRRSYTWDGFNKAVKMCGWPRRVAVVNICPFVRKG